MHLYRLTGLKRTPHLNGALCISTKAMSDIDESDDTSRIEATLSVSFKNLVCVRAKRDSLEIAAFEPLIPAVPEFDKDAASMIMLHCDWYTLKELSRVSHFWRQCALQQLRAWKGPRALIQNSRGSFHILIVLFMLFPFDKWGIDDRSNIRDYDWLLSVMKPNFQKLARANTLGLPFDTAPVLSEWSSIFKDANRANDANEFHIYLEMIFRLPKSTEIIMTRMLETLDGLEVDVRHEPTNYINVPSSDCASIGVTNYIHNMIHVGQTDTFTGSNQYMNSQGQRVDARMSTFISKLSDLVRVHIIRHYFTDAGFGAFTQCFNTDFVSFEQTMTIEQANHQTIAYALKAALCVSNHCTGSNRVCYTYFVLGTDGAWYKITEDYREEAQWTQLYTRTTYEEVKAQPALMLWYIAENE